MPAPPRACRGFFASSPSLAGELDLESCTFFSLIHLQTSLLDTRLTSLSLSLCGRLPNRTMADLYEPDVKSGHAVGATDITLEDVVKEHVEPKYRGTDQDKLDMKVLGRSQETRRMFTAISMLG